jgi:hypothetical protein
LCTNVFAKCVDKSKKYKKKKKKTTTTTFQLLKKMEQTEGQTDLWIERFEQEEKRKRKQK